MFGSQKSHNPDKPQGGKHDPPPNPDDRYAPANCVRLDLVDSDGKPATVYLTRRAAIALADNLLTIIPRMAVEGGGK